MRRVVEVPVALEGLFLGCGFLAPDGVRTGPPTIPLFALGGIVLRPHSPGSVVVDDPAAEPPPARLAGTRRRRSPGREGTCRSPT